jgi:hypothetical protein
MAEFLDLQNGFYNALSQGLGFSPDDPFQVIQPCPPLARLNADTLLWQYFNNIPPFSLTQNTILSGGNQFLVDYSALMSALEAQPNTFKQTIGDDAWDAWQEAIKNGVLKDVPITSWPMTFRNWALMSGWDSVANQGASAYARALLDPIFAAQNAVLGYQPVGTQPVDFVPGYNTLMLQLLSAPSRSFNVETTDWSYDVESTWTSGKHSGFFGIFSGSSFSSTLSQKFASSGVSLSASFANVTQFAATPGDWYNSGAFGLAFNTKSGPPWVDGNPITWEKTFGSSGNMQRFAPNLVVANQMDITVESQATYSQEEQTEINNNSHKGLWPFYSSDSENGSSTEVGFGAAGHMKVRTKSQAGVAIVLGCTVLPVGEYLGHESETSKIHAAVYAR